MIWRPLSLLAVAGVLCALIGCVSTGAVQQELEAHMRLGDYPTAIQTVEDQRERAYRGKNRLLYFLERGMLLQVDGQYADSNTAFETAKRVANELYATSVSGTGISLMTNDYALDYAG